jgi:hypothetical protein
MFSAYRPCIAAHVFLAITGTPASGANFAGAGVGSIFTTFSTPHILAINRAAGGDVEHIDDADFAFAQVTNEARSFTWVWSGCAIGSETASTATSHSPACGHSAYG